jgi:hypothetical protein
VKRNLFEKELLMLAPNSWEHAELHDFVHHTGDTRQQD